MNRLPAWDQESTIFAELLRELASDHAVLLVEHDMDVVFAVARRMTVMLDGRVLARFTRRDQGLACGARRLWTRSVSASSTRSVTVPIVEARGVSAGYGASEVLRGIDFAVRAVRRSA